MAKSIAVMNIVLPVLFIGGFIYALFSAYLFFMQSRLLFYPELPSRELQGSPKDIGLEFESVTLSTRDDVLIHGWYIPAARQKGVLLFFHGNAGNISHRLDSLLIFHNLGLSTLIIDYRGYGQSEGRVSEEGTYLDAEAAWDFLISDKKISASDIVIFGRSLGGAVAAHLAIRNSPGGLILESAFTSVPDMAASLYPVFPVRLLSRFRYDTREALAGVHCRVLIVHSPDDEIIPYENGRQLFETANNPKTFLEIRGGHNDGFLTSGNLYLKGLSRFIVSALGGSER